ncbi:hypothetical protein B9Z55_025452 [Caenorhabditis nigoni]|uniref:F-box domain-containing protein n=1 Tax=Caenorhabditis nigoni TaxID=1611254 RepID=A0A2G5SYE3_9PELO|nr:hypothetical protein B9Z55_025452 [Caenorhabditis nigoni]
MQLSKYPQLVQNMILNNMEYSDLFIFSFVSKKTKKLIESSPRMKRFKSVNTIRYEHHYDRTMVSIPFHQFHDNMLQIIESDDAENDTFQLNVCGKLFDFGIIYDGNKYYPVAFSQADNSLIAAIHDYLLDFFGNSVEYYWHALDCRKPIPQLQNISACFNLAFANSILDMGRFENFISSSPVLKFIDMYIENTTAPFSPESKFYQAEHIDTYQFEPTLPDTLRHFKGRQAFLEYLRCNIHDVIELVNKWKSGEAFNKLEVIEVKISVDFNQNEIMHAIGAKHIDHAKKPPTHTLPKVYRDIAFDEEPNTDPITSYTYVVRETDSRVASVLVHDRTFNFGVWDKTEDEFLRIMD